MAGRAGATIIQMSAERAARAAVAAVTPGMGGVMERLKPMDAQFVDAENEDSHASFAIASIAIFEGRAPSYADFFAAVEGRVALVPIYRRKLREVPLGLGPPVWVDDP